LSSCKRVLTTQIGLVRVEVIRPAKREEGKELGTGRWGKFCSRKRFVLLYVKIWMALRY
jgi:hypothetical protein